jgi:hypothetical protein
MSADLIPTPSLDTWTDGQLITYDWLNRNVRDVQRFLAYAPLTIVQRLAAQSIAANVNTPITFDTEITDVDSMFTGPSSHLVAQRQGVYAIQFQAHFVSNATGLRASHIAINDSAAWVSSYNNEAANGVDTLLNCSAIVPLDVGDTISGWVWQDSGGSLSSGSTGYSAPRLSCRLVSTSFADLNTGAATPPPATPPTGSKPTKHTATFGAVWSRSFAGNGSTRHDDPGVCYQGGDTAHTYNGDQKSLIGFNYNAIHSALAGATNVTGTFNAKILHCWFNSGSPIYPTYHTYSSKPGTWAQANVKSMGHTGSIRPGTVNTFNLSAAAVAGFQNGTVKGMGFGPAPTTSLNYYAYMCGATSSPVPTLTFTYWK